MNSKVSAYIERIKDKNIHVVGLSGIESYQVVRFLHKHKIRNVTCHDLSTQQQLKKKFMSLHLYLPRKQRLQAYKELMRWRYKRYYRPDYLKDISKADIVFLSQNWFAYEENAPLEKLVIKNKNIEKSSLTNLYFELACCPVIGVSGSMGKSTTTSAIVAILKQVLQHATNLSGKIYQGGNDRKAGQVLENIDRITDQDVLVLEISNRQLKYGIHASPQVGVLTNVVPNHIEDHRTFLQYLRTKQRLLRYQKDKNVAILNWDNEHTRELASKYRRRCILFSGTELLGRGVYVQNGWIYLREQMNPEISKSVTLKVMPVAEVPLVGQHNLSNVMAAIAAVYGFLRYIGVCETEVLQSVTLLIRQVIGSLNGLPGRLELVGTKKGVEFIYDIKSTIPDETIAALTALNSRERSSFNYRKSYETYTIHSKRGLESDSSGKNEKNIVLIAGGEDKDVSYKQLATELVKYVRLLYLLPGSGSDKIRIALKKTKARQSLQLLLCDDLFQVFDSLKQNTHPGDKVLLSPGCAGFYSSFISGSKGFRELVRRF